MRLPSCTDGALSCLQIARHPSASAALPHFTRGSDAPEPFAAARIAAHSGTRLTQQHTQNETTSSTMQQRAAQTGGRDAMHTTGPPPTADGAVTAAASAATHPSSSLSSSWNPVAALGLAAGAAHPSLAERRQRRLEEAAAAAAAAAASGSTNSRHSGPEIPLASLVPYPLDTCQPRPALAASPSPSIVRDAAHDCTSPLRSGTGHESVSPLRSSAVPENTSPLRSSAVYESTSILPPAAPILKPSTPTRWTSSLGLTLSPGSTAKAVSFAQQLEAVRNIPSRGSSYVDDEQLELLDSLGSGAEQSNPSTKLARKTPRPKKKKTKKPRSTHEEYDSSGLSDRTPRNRGRDGRKFTTGDEEDENEEDECLSPLTAQLLAAAAQITLAPNEIPPMRAPSPSLGSAPSPLRAPGLSKPAALIESPTPAPAPPAKLSPTLTAAILEASEQAEVVYAAEQMQAASSLSPSSMLVPSRLVELQQNRTALFARVASRRSASASSNSASSSVSSLLSAGSGSSSISSGSSGGNSLSFTSSQSSSTAHSPIFSPALAPTTTTATVTLSHARYASQGQGYKQRSSAELFSSGGRFQTAPAALQGGRASSAARERERDMQRIMPAPHSRTLHAASATPSSPPPPASTSADDTLSALGAIPAGKHTPSPPRSEASPRIHAQQQRGGGGAPGDSVPVRSPRGAARLVRTAGPTGSAQTRAQAPRVASAARSASSGTSGADAWLEQHARECADKQLRQQQHQQHARAFSVSVSLSAPRPASFLFPSSSVPPLSRSPKQGYAVAGPQGGFAMGIVGRRAAGTASVVGGSSTGTAGWTPVAVASGVAPFGALGAAANSSSQPESRARSNVPSPRGTAAATSIAPRPSSSLGLHNSSSCYVSPAQPQPKAKANSKRLSGPLLSGGGTASSSAAAAVSWSFAR